VHAGRVLSALSDSAVVVLLPALLTSLGASRAGALLGGALYAVYPPAVVYGSLAYLDPLLAPLFAALLVVLARKPDERRSWIVAGVLSGLCVATKQTGMVALLIAPLVLLRTRNPARAIAEWTAVTLVVVCAFVNPVAYATGLLHPLDPYARLRPIRCRRSPPTSRFWRDPTTTTGSVTRATAAHSRARSPLYTTY
jgi:predicted membrane-bound dolichyl-phosphate-mannose-protein mannosyltransferase